MTTPRLNFGGYGVMTCEAGEGCCYADSQTCIYTGDIVIDKLLNNNNNNNNNS